MPNQLDSMTDDELSIRNGYSTHWGVYAIASLPLLVASFFEIKWVLAVGFGLVVLGVDVLNDRLYDICVRSRRTNLLLSDRKSK